MAVQSASTIHQTPLPQDERWLEEFLRSGCIFPSRSNRVWVGWGDAKRSTFPIESRLSVFAPDFLLDEPHPWHAFGGGMEMSFEELAEVLSEELPPQPNVVWQEPDRRPFEAAFGDIQTRIAAGELSKAVPSIVRTTATDFSPSRRAHALRHLLKAAKDSPLMPYGLWSEEEGMLGATPEILFDQLPSGDLETMALAGTRRPNGHDESLLNDPKEVFEHQVVVNGIVERLLPFGQVEVGPTHEIRLPALVHLHTRICVRDCDHVGFSEWVAALHPTPAIGAWPLEAGWRWLRSQTNAQSRKRYGAPFGLIAPGETIGRCLVAIRNLQWDANHAWITAGGGIVAASVLEREWSELNSKLDSVQEALRI